MHFSKRLDRFGDEIFAALNNRKMELEQQGMKIYNMSVGTPDFKTPEHIKKALAEAAMDDENWKYSLRDIPELLDAVCEYYQKRFQVEITPDMVMSVYGSQEGMGHLGMAICDEGHGSSSGSLLPGIRGGKSHGGSCSLLLSPYCGT